MRTSWVRTLVESNQWLKNVYLSLPSLALGIIRVGQGAMEWGRPIIHDWTFPYLINQSTNKQKQRNIVLFNSSGKDNGHRYIIVGWETLWLVLLKAPSIYYNCQTNRQSNNQKSNSQPKRGRVAGQPPENDCPHGARSWLAGRSSLVRDGPVSTVSK